MRTMKIHSMAAVFGLCLAPALAAAADEPAAAAAAEPVAAAAEPPAGTPPADPAGPVPAPEPAPVAPAAPASADPTADTGAADVAPASTEAPSTLINIDVEGASAYVWRGMNLFGGTDQSKQNFSVFPSLTATFGGLSVGYWGAFQVTGEGDNDPGTLVDAGVGAETDLIVKYSGTLAENLSYSAMLTYWIYAAADEAVALTKTPMYLEPGVGVTYTTAADLGLYVGYYRGLQDVTNAYSFIYINPSVGKTIPLSGDIGLALGLSGGYKVFTDDPATQDKALDLTLNAGVTLPFSDLYITPQVHASYVTRDIPGDTEFGDQFIAWAGVHVGYNIGL
jgi:hypothetical protein